MSQERDVPGSLLRKITEEHRYMNEFAELLGRRLELDSKYLDSLEALISDKVTVRAWPQSKLWPLFSPLFDYFQEELNERRRVLQSLESAIRQLLIFDSPDVDDKSEESVFEKYQQLAVSYDHYEDCRTQASSPDAVRKLQTWHEEELPWILFISSNEQLQRSVLPEAG
ncbi:hypothetical protein CPB86DRAFT_788834 [Serendipita vermifera]|nr:hypothetical protein CPB86DRAFT_788834 [Serendipita vermifera]